MTARPEFTKRDEYIRVAAAQAGLVISPFGRGWRLHGAGIDVLVSDLRHVHPDHDLALPAEAVGRRGRRL